MKVRDKMTLAPETVTDVSTGRVKRRRTRTPSEHPQAPATARTMPAPARRTALGLADGDANRLWFDTDGSVWTLNHSRAERCSSPACPACKARKSA